MPQEFLIDTIHQTPLKYSGAVKDWKHTEDGKKPVISTVSTTLRGVLTPGSKLFPYEITDENIKKITGIGRADVYVLVPTHDIPEYSGRDYKQSLYNKHLSGGDSETIRQLNDEIERKDDELNRLRNQLDKAQAEEEEQSDSGSSGPPMLKCAVCKEKSRKSSWDSSDQNKEGYCPSCGQGVSDNANRVN